MVPCGVGVIQGMVFCFVFEFVWMMFIWVGLGLCMFGVFGFWSFGFSVLSGFRGLWFVVFAFDGSGLVWVSCG